MSLYLSRIILNPFSAGALRLAGSPEEVHKALLRTLSCGPTNKDSVGHQPKTAQVLFRIEPMVPRDGESARPGILVQSAEPPEWEKLGLSQSYFHSLPETKIFDPSISLGQSFGFRLLCRPTFRKASSGSPGPIDKVGQRISCRTPEQREAWLFRKADQHGFRVDRYEFTVIAQPILKPTGHRESPESEDKKQNRRTTFTSVRFDGELTVLDPEKFLSAIRDGIGTQKAFGFGLLSLSRT
jgi:CRISPR system Cascade subunit CasE